jgi:hypothetical protein
MDASFTWRRTCAKDLSECLTLRPAKNGAEGVGHKTATAVWRQLFEMTHASRSAVIEMHCDGSVEIVGFGFASFVKKDFADAEALNPRPGLNCRIIESASPADDPSLLPMTKCGIQILEVSCNKSSSIQVGKTTV